MAPAPRRGFRASFREVLPVWAVLRGALFLVLYYARISFGERFGPTSKPWVAFPQNRFLDSLARWDSGWYSTIVENGYSYSGPMRESNVAFFPAYPMLAKALAPLFPNHFAAGIFVSNVAFLLGLVVLHRWVEESFDARHARRAVLLMLLYPTTVFFSAYYTESLFLLEAVTAFYCYSRENYLGAGLAGAFASGTRSTGIMLLPAFALGEIVKLVRARRWPTLRWTGARLPLLLIPVGLVLYMLFLKQKFGDPLVFSKVQAAWGRTFGNNPLSVLQAQWLRFENEPWERGEVVGSALCVAVLVLSVPKLDAAGLFFASVGTLLPLTTGMVASELRYFSTAIPLLPLLAVYTRHPGVRFTVYALFGAMAALTTARFALWFWAG